MDEVKQKRVIDLSRYAPDFLHDVREFNQIYQTEEKEIEKLHEKMDQLWTDSLIREASIQGIKRFEAITSLKPFPEDTLEERRTAVLMKWNQQLPYTLARLKERLDGAVGSSGYRLYVKNQQYILEIQVIDQTAHVLRTLFEMTKQMIPANLILDFSGCYPMNVEIPVEYENKIRLGMGFYPRYNLAYLYLDGRWKLDGSKVLNGYDGNDLLDFYPADLAIPLQVIAAPDHAASAQALQMNVRQNEFAESAVKVLTEVPVLVEEGEDIPLFMDGSVCMDGELDMSGYSEKKKHTTPGIRIHFSADVKNSVGAKAAMTEAHHIAYMDGAWKLDGGRNLDAYFIHHTL